MSTPSSKPNLPTETKPSGESHRSSLLDRARLQISGVCEVISFDESAVVLNTSLGTMLIQGRELKLKTLSLDGGQVAVDGVVTALSYEEPRQRGSWTSRLFK